MTTDKGFGGPGEDRPTYWVRRLPDTKSWFRTRRNYEVVRLPPGATQPEWTRETDHPHILLRRQGMHPTDIYDHVAAADEMWNGGVGPWRNPYSSLND